MTGASTRPQEEGRHARSANARHRCFGPSTTHGRRSAWRQPEHPLLGSPGARRTTSRSRWPSGAAGRINYVLQPNEGHQVRRILFVGDVRPALVVRRFEHKARPMAPRRRRTVQRRRQVQAPSAAARTTARSRRRPAGEAGRMMASTTRRPRTTTTEPQDLLPLLHASRRSRPLAAPGRSAPMSRFPAYPLRQARTADGFHGLDGDLGGLRLHGCGLGETPPPQYCDRRLADWSSACVLPCCRPQRCKRSAIRD